MYFTFVRVHVAFCSYRRQQRVLNATATTDIAISSCPSATASYNVHVPDASSDSPGLRIRDGKCWTDPGDGEGSDRAFFVMYITFVRVHVAGLWQGKSSSHFIHYRHHQYLLALVIGGLISGEAPKGKVWAWRREKRVVVALGRA